jgi:hypothetical protein
MTAPRPTAATNQAAQPDTSIYITRFRSLTESHGEQDSYADWAELCTDLEASIDRIANKSEGEGWSPAVFTGDVRAKRNAESISCLVLDYDTGTTSLEDAFDFWAFEAFAPSKKTRFTTACLVHTSYSHTPEHPKFRVVLPFSRAVDAKEFEAIWTHAVDLATKAGHEIDVACKDPSRFWFLPACKPGDKVDLRFYEAGDPVDVRRILKECGYKARSKADGTTSKTTASSALRSFERGLEEVREAPEGTRNPTLNKVAFKAGTLVGGARLDEDYARKELREAGLTCGLDPAEVESTLHNALQAGKQHPSTGDWDERPEIKLNGELHEHVQDAMKVLGQHPKLFQKDGRLVLVETSPTGGAHVSGVEDTRLQEMMSESGIWLAPAKSGKGNEKINPPKNLAEALVKRGSWEHIKPLRAVTNFPILDSTGHLRLSSGYDEKTKTFYAGNVEVRVPEAPTREDAKKAVATLLDIVCDFPFVDDAHESAWLAALLSPLSRFMHEGNIPLVLVQANDRRVGKSKLAGLISLIVTGQSAAIMVHSQGDEERKRIGTVLLAGYPVVLIDNVETQFGTGGNMNALVTSRVWVDRKLGKMTILRAENNATWIVNGKNITLAPDMAQRCLHIRLQCNEEKPELRSEFKHQDLESMVLARRGEFLGAALTILRAYVQDGMPDQGLPAWGSFEPWSKLVRGALVWAGMPDPALTREELEGEADTELAFETGLIEGWEEAQVALSEFTGLTASQVLKHLERSEPKVCPILREALEKITPPRSPLPTPNKLGQELRKVKRKIRNGKRLEPVGSGKEALRWVVVSTP